MISNLLFSRSFQLTNSFRRLYTYFRIKGDPLCIDSDRKEEGSI